MCQVNTLQVLMHAPYVDKCTKCLIWTFAMMWHPCHRPLCCHGSQCSDMDPKKNVDPNVVDMAKYMYMDPNAGTQISRKCHRS
jgi:hypothetical protein